MVVPDPQAEDKGILAALAIALVHQPRATLQDLARAIGTSKATLYRFCRTREQLVDRLVLHSTHMITEAIRSAELDSAPPLDALRCLITNHLEHRELTMFLMHYCKEVSSDSNYAVDWQASVDAFFLRGQQEGTFRIDISAPCLTEIWVATMVGLVDAERRGRIARAGMAALLERVLLHGIAAEGC